MEATTGDPMSSLNEDLYHLIWDVALTRRAAPAPIDPGLMELIQLQAENAVLEGEVDRLTELLEIVVEDNGRLKDQLVAYKKALGVGHARFKIEKYLRMSYAISLERRMPGETAEAAFERLSSTRELKLAAQVASENLVALGAYPKKVE